jgi:hypothetical protein
MRIDRRRVRRGLLLGALASVGACSGSDPDPVAAPAPTVVPDPTGPVDDALDAGSEIGADDVPPTTVTAGRPFVVSVSVEGASADLDGSVEVAIDPADPERIDPFGTYAACSGLRRSVGVYSVLVSAVDGPIASISVLTFERIDGPGIHDADVRIERRGGDPIVAVGTVTIADDLRSGSFLGFVADGGSVTGAFRCEGSEAGPEPLDPGVDDGVVDTVEVFVLLRRDRAERVVGLAIDGDDPTADIECPGATGTDAGLLVRVDGDRSVGAVTTFELSDGNAAAMRLRVGDVSFRFDDVTVEADDRRVTATFEAVEDGVTAVGAYSCS